MLRRTLVSNHPPPPRTLLGYIIQMLLNLTFACSYFNLSGVSMNSFSPCSFLLHWWFARQWLWPVQEHCGQQRWKQGWHLFLPLWGSWVLAGALFLATCFFLPQEKGGGKEHSESGLLAASLSNPIPFLQQPGRYHILPSQTQEKASSPHP